MKTSNNSKEMNSNLLKESLLDYNNLANQLKESTPEIVKDLLAEQVKKAYSSILNESEEDDDEEKDDEFDVEEVDDTTSEPDEDEVDSEDSDEDEDDDVVDDDDEIVDGDEEDDEEGMDQDDAEDIEDAEAEDGEIDDVDPDFEQFKVDGSEDKYDLRNAKDSDVVKLYKLINDDDNVQVVKDQDKVKISDNETGAEYIIELGDDEDTSDIITDDNLKSEDMNESRIYEIALNEYDSHVGYTDDYQHKTAMTGNAKETSKYGRNIDKGVTDSEAKPWSHEKKSVAPFNVKAKGVEEDVTRYGVHNNGQPIQHRPLSKTKRRAANWETAEGRKVGTGEAPYSGIEESIARKTNKIFEDNKKLKAMLGQFETKLQEAAVTNVNLGGIIKLISENSTSKAEKKSIINRFVNEARTVKESQNLYKRISEELKQKPAVNANINEEKQFGNSKNSEVINESKFYQDESLMNSLGLMHKLCK